MFARFIPSSTLVFVLLVSFFCLLYLGLGLFSSLLFSYLPEYIGCFSFSTLLCVGVFGNISFYFQLSTFESFPYSCISFLCFISRLMGCWRALVHLSYNPALFLTYLTFLYFLFSSFVGVTGAFVLFFLLAVCIAFATISYCHSSYSFKHTLYLSFLSFLHLLRLLVACRGIYSRA